MNLGLARPTILISLNHVDELDYIRDDGDVVRDRGDGRVTRASSPTRSSRAACPLLAEAARPIGDVQVRNRGTIGGSASPTPTRRRTTCPCSLALGATLGWPSAPGRAGDRRRATSSSTSCRRRWSPTSCWSRSSVPKLAGRQPAPPTGGWRASRAASPSSTPPPSWRWARPVRRDRRRRRRRPFVDRARRSARPCDVVATAAAAMAAVGAFGDLNATPSTARDGRRVTRGGPSRQAAGEPQAKGG